MTLRRYIIAAIVTVASTYATPGAGATNVLPPPIVKLVKLPLSQVGSGVYHKLGFSIYAATLWAPDGVWDSKKICVLQLRYNRSLSKQTLVSSTIDSIREQNVADEATLMQWQKTLESVLPAVNKNDEIVGILAPGRDAHLFFNGRHIATIKDHAFSNAFFAIWLGNKADPALRTALLGPVGSDN